MTHIYFGGSFFPPHKAHTEMLKLALNESRDATLVLVPTKQNPLKDSPGASISLIQAWLEDLGETLGPQDFSRCRLETHEMLSSENQNFTSDTLASIVNPGEKWALLLGSDSALQFARWKNPNEILKIVKELWVVPRGQNTPDEIQKSLRSLNKEVEIKVLKTVTKISSTDIRNGASSQPLSDFLSPRVLTVWKQLGYC